MTNKKFINRKDFIVQSTSLLTASLLTMRGFTAALSSKYKMGWQRFTVRDSLAKDLAGTVRKIASIGYEDSETYGFDPDAGTYYGIKASSFKQLLADNNMITTSGHYDFTTYFDK